VLVVREGTREHLIPLAASICVEIDTEGKLIRVDPPEGLIEF
jgi:ribosomal 30S subunit maturation factor RimM